MIQKYEDGRGVIESIINNKQFSSVLRITSAKGSVRANHYHKEDYHYCYLESGEMDYYDRQVGSEYPPTVTKIKSGDVFYTGPMIEHAMKFTEDSVFWCFSKLSRNQDNYESDTVRLKTPLA